MSTNLTLSGDIGHIREEQDDLFINNNESNDFYHDDNDLLESKHYGGVSSSTTKINTIPRNDDNDIEERKDEDFKLTTTATITTTPEEIILQKQFADEGSVQILQPASNPEITTLHQFDVENSEQISLQPASSPEIILQQFEDENSGQILQPSSPEILLRQFEIDHDLQPNNKRNSHFYSSVDDITRDSPIRQAACTSCALCDANTRDLNVKRNKEGGFQLRKSASCSICTWDIEEFEFDDNLCNNNEDVSSDEHSLGDSLDEAEEEEYEEEEDQSEIKIEDSSLSYIENSTNNGPEDHQNTSPIQQPPSSGRQRSNSYTRAMDDDSDLLEGSIINSSSDHNFNLSQRLPPDGGEITEEVVEQQHTKSYNQQENKKGILRSSSPKTPRRKGFGSSSSSKSKSAKSQTTIDKKISQELDEIFGKLHRSPQQSFEHDDDTFDLNDSNNLSINSSRGSSKRGSFRKLIKTPSFLKRHKKTKLDVSKSRSVEYLYTSEPVIDFDMKKSVSTMDMSSSYYQDLNEENSEDLELNVDEAFIEYLDNIGGTVLFSGNEILRFLWHQITTYQHELIGPFDDFMKSILDEIQQAYKKCQDLETTLSLKVQHQERETSKIYEDAETALRQEREQLLHKHSEKEEQIKNELSRIIKSKENELQDIVKRNNELVSREEKLTNENHEIKHILEKLEDQYGSSTSNEAVLAEKSESLKTENLALIEKLKLQEDALQHLHDQLIQATTNAGDSRENYEKLVRRFKDLNEEKEQLEASCSNLTTDLEELKTHQHHHNNSGHKPPRFDKQLSWSTTSSIDLGDNRDPNHRPASSIDDYEDTNRALTDSMSYNKVTDSVLFMTRHQNSRSKHSASPTPSADIDERNRYIQTPSGMTALRSQESLDQQQQNRYIQNPAIRSQQSFDHHQQNTYNQTPSGMNTLRSQDSFDHPQTDRSSVANNDSTRRNYQSSTPIQNTPMSASKKRLLYDNPSPSKTPIRMASNKQNEFKVIFTGDPNVGKTSLIRRICQGRFKDTREITTEMDCGTKIVNTPEFPVTLKLWDTVGQEKFNSIPGSYFRKSDIVVCVYDIHDEGSFLNARKWIRQIHDYTNENIFLFLIGNKTDMHHKRVIAPKRAECLAAENDAIYIETSAKSAENTDKLCQLMVSTMLEREDTVFIRNDFEGTLCSLSYSQKRKNEVSICCS